MDNGISTLRAAGELLYGGDWQSPLSRALGVDGRMMRFWVAGERPVPAHIINRLPELLRQVSVNRRREADTLDAMANSMA